jgi:VCBS repeat protein
VSGSYDPGDLYLFRGLGHGKYAAVKPLTDETGTPLVHHPEELKKFKEFEKKGDPNSEAAVQQRVASFGSWPGFVDWDGDGDLDLLIGSFQGEVYLRTNQGTRSAPVWAAQSVRVVDERGEPLKVMAHADVNPADWDGDGLFDLVIGSGDGSVSWYRNVGANAKPKFGARQELIPARSDSIFLTQYFEPDEEFRSGARAQIAVVDHDGDGRLDLLLGDFSQVRRLRELDLEERRKFDQLLRTHNELEQKLAESHGDESDERKNTVKEYEAAQKALEEFTNDGGGSSPPSSFVWLFRRTPGNATPAAGGGG